MLDSIVSHLASPVAQWKKNSSEKKLGQKKQSTQDGVKHPEMPPPPQKKSEVKKYLGEKKQKHFLKAPFWWTSLKHKDRNWTVFLPESTLVVSGADPGFWSGGPAEFWPQS